MPEIFSKLDIVGTVIAIVVIIVAGILLNSRVIDFVTFIILLIIGLIVPVGKILYPIIIRDILKLEEEKKRIKRDVFEDWILVWNRLKEVRVMGAQQEGKDDLTYLPDNHTIIQKSSLYVAEITLAEWLKTVKQGSRALNNPKLADYKAVIVFDIYSGKIVEERIGQTLAEWEKDFPTKAEQGYYSKAIPAPKIIIPPALAPYLPMAELSGQFETSGSGQGGKKK